MALGWGQVGSHGLHGVVPKAVLDDVEVFLVGLFELSVIASGVGAGDDVPVGPEPDWDGEVTIDDFWCGLVRPLLAEFELLSIKIGVGGVDLLLPVDAYGVSRDKDAARGAPAVDRAGVREVERVDAVVFNAGLMGGVYIGVGFGGVL